MIDFLKGISDANRDNRFFRPQLRQRRVINAAAIAKTKTASIKSRERRKKNVGIARSAFGRGFGKAVGAFDEIVARREITKHQRVTHLVHHRQRHAITLVGQRIDQRTGVEFAADRPIDRDNRRVEPEQGGGFGDKRETVARQGCCGGVRFRRAHQIAFGQRMATEFGFHIGHDQQPHRARRRKCGPHEPWDIDPGKPTT